MSRLPTTPTPATPRLVSARRPSSALQTLPLARRASTSTGPGPARTAAAASRTSKTTQKLVLLPSDPQTKPLPSDIVPDGDEDQVHGYETDAGVRVRERKSAAERMGKAERRRAGYRRITAYCVAESVRLKVLASFLRREHNVAPRAYDNVLYAAYHLPLFPGYGPNANVRSAAAPADAINADADAADEAGYQGTYFAADSAGFDPVDGYISTSPMADRRLPAQEPPATDVTENENETDVEAPLVTPPPPALPDTPLSPPPATATTAGTETSTASPPLDTAPPPPPPPLLQPPPPPPSSHEDIAEALFFTYGVVVFFGLDEAQERAILEDVAAASALRRVRPEDAWEVEELNYAYDRTIASPRIYNDFFTFKQPSHLLTLSIAHALAQSTLLAYYESLTNSILSAPTTTSIPLQLARTGVLRISRTDAMRLTGRLFRLRRDVVLIGNVLDVPDVFWEEASLRSLYDAAREYFEIGARVRGVEERVAGARDLLDAIHDHLNNNAMERITWIIIWLIVAACLVEVGEVIARLVVHATTVNSPRTSTVTKLVSGATVWFANNVTTSNTAPALLVQRAGTVLDLSAMSREEALRAVDGMFTSGTL